MKLPKKKHRSIHQLKKELQKVLHKWVRLRDKGLPCIACQRFLAIEDSHASHYLPSTHSATKYDPDNIHAGCISCNLFKHGNLIEYRINLIKKIGEDKVKELEAKRHDIVKWDRTWLEEQIEHYKQSIKIMEL